MRALLAIVLLAACGDDVSLAPDAADPDAASIDAAVIDAPPIDAPSTVPTDPLTYTAGTPFTVDNGVTSWVLVPASYDSTHHTPTSVLVWLHGCGGESAGDIYTVSPRNPQSWISLAVGGREGDCWDPNTDVPTVLAALATLETHFNIDRHRVVLGGYSAGGDLAYRAAFYNATMFAGVLAENTAPFRDTGSSQAASLAAAAWKFPVIHLAHLQDTTYPIATVRAETDAMIVAGFPVMRVEVDGTHYDNAGATVNGHAVPGTTADLRTYLLPALDGDWVSP